jgi:HPt (histidine-containing phosphotransfer) domain-containing protein
MATSIQYEAALGRLGGDVSLYREMADCLFEDAPLLIRQMRESIASKSVAELTRAAHTLKSLAATVGAQSLSEAAAEIERQSSLGAIDAAADLVAVIDPVLADGVAAIKNRLGD